ncbi:MAG: alpha/beta hydrolase [Firmicutes bacterium]|nr:alpha/beta hydrolase [Bacillota bacterium]
MHTLLFLHGWGGNEHSFSNITPILQYHFNCLSISMPMFQKDDLISPQTPWTLEDYAAYVETFLDSHNVEKCHILAHSFGARITALLVNRNPNRYEKLVLTGAAGIKPRKSLNTKLKIALYKTRKKLNLIKTEQGSPDYKKLTPVGKQTFNNIINRDLKPEISNINHPILLIFGKHDTATPPKMGRQWKKLAKNSTLIIYPNSGHFTYIDETQKFLANTLMFLKN